MTDAEPYQVEMTADFHPWRRQMTFKHSNEAPIRPLLDDLSFIRDKKKWDFPFRRGLFEIGQTDFESIAGTMGVTLEAT